MLFWLLLAMMTGVAMLSVLWPLSRNRARGRAPRSADIAVYLDQLDEVERDRENGRMLKQDAAAARIEVSRRLLAASNEIVTGPRTGNTRNRRRLTAGIAFLGIPATALAIYFAVGSPERTDGTVSARVENRADQSEIELLIKQVESHLAAQANDGRGWELLAPVYLRLGRTGNAVKARVTALQLLGPTADREANLGEALVADAKGTVTAEAFAAFDRARSIEEKHVKARYFIALAAEQDGRKNDARAIWREMAAEAPADAPWLPSVRAALARVEGTK
jgi:cytochrome c-type biogenesis protein CcmH